MKAIILLSSGIDSPVAAYMMQRKGIDAAAYLYMDIDHSEKSRAKVRALAERLDSVLSRKEKTKLIIHDYLPYEKGIMQSCNRRFQCILCKRGMYMAAERYAKQEGADIIITGESLGQVASQTLDNLFVLDSAAQIPIIRPLIGFDKEDTIRIAKDIGTYDISIQKSPHCPFLPEKPATKSALDKVLKEEARIA